METSSRYDIVLFLHFFRENHFFLNLVSELGASRRIGILDLDGLQRSATGDRVYAMRRRRDKVKTAGEVFLKLCLDRGAELLDASKACSCGLLLVPEAVYLGSETQNIRFDKAIGVVRDGTGPMPEAVSEWRRLGVREIWAPDTKIFRSALAESPFSGFEEEFRLVSMGLPDRKYPVFDFASLEIDYLVAYPTIMLLKDLETRRRLFENMLRLIDGLPARARVVLKQHNVKDANVFAAAYPFLSKVSLWSGGALERLLGFLLDRLPAGLRTKGLGRRLYNLYLSCLTFRLEARCLKLADLTEYYNLSAEVFLPFVRKGVITGISTVMWHALFNRIPVYNCDDQPLLPSMPNYTYYKNFYVEPCGGEPRFDVGRYSLVDEGATTADFIRMAKDASDGF